MAAYRITIDVIWHDALAAMKALEPSADQTIQSATTYRDRLMLALLAFTLLRRKNLAQLQLDRDLTRTVEGWILKVEGHTVKNHREIVRLLPVTLGRHIDFYLKRVRPKLLRGKQSDGLWINNVGGMLQQQDVAKAIKRTTRRMFGVELTPHDLRRIAPTTIATDAPKQIYLAIRRDQRPCDADLYKERNIIERFFSKLKQFRRVATRYDKLLANFMGFVKLAAIAIWLK